MTDAMLAVRWHGRSDVRVDRVSKPPRPGRGEVLVAVELAGICGTDIEEWRRGPINIATETHPLTRQSAPLTLGHEIVGRVIESGDGCRIAAGTRVGIEVNLSCGECRACLSGETQLCARLGSLGLHGDGGMAEQIVVPESIAVEIPPGVPFSSAVLAEPLAVAVRAFRLAGAVDTSRVIVVGGGAVGQLAARLALKRTGAVALIEPLEGRRRLAERHGVAAYSDGELADDDHSLYHADSLADVVLECSGAPQAAQLAATLVRPGGVVALLGISQSALPLSSWDLVRKEIRVIGVLSHTMKDFQAAMEALGNGLDVSDIVTSIVPLRDALDRAFEELENNPQRHLKILLKP